MKIEDCQKREKEKFLRDFLEWRFGGLTAWKILIMEAGEKRSTLTCLPEAG